LLWFDGFVRIVIASANLIPQDWNMCENILFIQDFFKGTKECRFKDDLCHMLVTMGVDDVIVNDLKLYEYF
jgi:hypothetical protein